MTIRSTVLAILVVFVAAGFAHADYIVSLSSGGQTAISVNPGDSFDVDIVLTSDAADEVDALSVIVEFTEVGLAYESHALNALGLFVDHSVPASGSLVQAGTYSFTPIAVDLRLSGGDPISSTFTQGVFATLTLSVPNDYSGDSSIGLAPLLDEASRFGIPVAGTSGDGLVVNVIPEPVLAGPVALLSLLAVRRRRVA